MSIVRTNSVRKNFHRVRQILEHCDADISRIV